MTFDDLLIKKMFYNGYMNLYELKQELLLVSCTYNYGWSKSDYCEVRMRIDTGWVCGRIRFAENGGRYASFLGVPYAKLPLGLLRFKELEPLDPWNSSVMLDATEDAPICPQEDFIFDKMMVHPRGSSEECIYLNVHIPLEYLPTNPEHLRPLKLLPILVFIHGGAFQSGSGLTDFCGPEYLLMQKVIVITFNYRLNVFGFLSLGTKEIPGNQGLRDMITLLRWVQRNARAFGGDPDNVTLMGHSAGGAAAHLLALSPATEGLFKRCMFLSGYAFPSFYTASPKYAKDIATAYLRKLNITTTDPGEIHQQLIRLPLLTLMEANKELQYETEVVTFAPVVETRQYPAITRVLDDFPLNLIAKGRGKEYPTILTYTNNEMAISKFFMQRKGCLPFLRQNPSRIVSPRLKYILNKDQLANVTSKIFDRYFKAGLTFAEVAEYYTDVYFKYPALKLAEWKESIGSAPMFNFKFSYESDYSPVKAAHWVDFRGASHMEDLALVFRVNSMVGNHRRAFPPRTKDDVMKIWMVFLTVNFMIYGNPTGFLQHEPWLKRNNTLRYCELREPLKLDIHELDYNEKMIVEFFDSIDPEISTRLQLFVDENVK